MTRRKRKEFRVKQRLEWAKSRQSKAAAADRTAQLLVDGIPFGQPILVGHHSEKRHRRTVERIQNATDKTIEHLKMAKHHQEKAEGIADQLEHTIFSDDVDAQERLQEKINTLEAERTRMKLINTEIRKGDGWTNRIQLTDAEKKDLAMNAQYSQCVGYPAYALQNISARIRDAKKRLGILSVRGNRNA